MAHAYSPSKYIPVILTEDENKHVLVPVRINVNYKQIRIGICYNCFCFIRHYFILIYVFSLNTITTVDSFCWNLYNSKMSTDEWANYTCLGMNLGAGYCERYISIDIYLISTLITTFT